MQDHPYLAQTGSADNGQGLPWWSNTSIAKGTGLIPGQGTKVSHAMLWGQTNFFNYKILKKKNKESRREQILKVLSTGKF